MWRLIACSALVVLGGCVVSADGVVEEQDAELDPRLLGHWEAVEGSDRVVISRGRGNAYVLEYTTGGHTGAFVGRLGRLGKQLVLDVWPEPGGEQLPEPYAALLIPGHLLLALELIGPDQVRLSMLEPDTLLSALAAGRVSLGHDTTESQLILHGTTGELRAALSAHIGSPGALDSQATWRRTRPTEAQPRPVDVPCFEAAAWRAADGLFRGDAHWQGSDVASTVELGGDRVLWLFGDTWIDPSGRGTREGGTMVSNSVAVQTGSDPSAAVVSFYWGRGPDGRPAALFPDREGESLWFGSGARADDRLVLFLGRTVRTGSATGLGFENAGWTAFLVENPDDPPSDWRVEELETPENPLGVVVGFAASFRRGEHVYALGSQNPVKSHPIFAVRWPVAAVRRGDLLAPEWWAGDRGWVPDTSSVQRWPLFEGGQSELSVHLDTVADAFLAVHTRGFGPADLVMRAAPALTGPWTGPRMIYRPPEYHRPNAMIYAGRAHPELTGADLVLTYATNTFAFAEHRSDSLIYYPRFVRLTRCERQ